MTAKPIETQYAGCRFRSRLEARWAVFFDAADIPWKYEPEGFELSCGWYLPDFLLPECGTWIEVKGDPARLDKQHLLTAAKELPRPELTPGQERGPSLMLLGDIPPPTGTGDWGWISVGDGSEENDQELGVCRYGFGTYYKNCRPWFLDNAHDGRSWLEPSFDQYEHNVDGAYQAARSARFEHGETPVPPMRWKQSHVPPVSGINPETGEIESPFEYLLGVKVPAQPIIDPKDYPW